MTIDEVRKLIARAIWPEDIWTSDADEADRIIAEREATLDRILTALEARGYVIEQGWQPIETAPVQDEFNPFLVTNGTSIWVADFWFEQEPEQYVFGSSGSPCSGATHWRPLPEPPAMLSATDGEAGGG